ncbi:MAG: permease [Christensenellales bacterium]
MNGLQAVGDFITGQILGMKWLNSLIGMAFTAVFGATFMSGHWGQAIQFFVYDTIKIVVLLCLLIFLISYIQSYFPPERTKKILGRFKGIGANVVGALLGTVTPFCSCSSIPIFMGFTRAGISSGVTFSFLISSPLVDLGAFILLAGVFGFPIAIAYVVVGLVLAVVGGTVIEKTGIGKQVREFILEGNVVEVDGIELTRKDRLIYAQDQTLSTLKKVWIYILIGVAVGAVIHNFIPTEWIQTVLGSDKWYAVPLATILGTPMYADIFGTIPVAEALFAKGVGVGTILSFMMSVTALSLPSLIMLSKAVKPKLLFWFIFIVVVGIMIIGFTFNAFNFLFV